MIIVIETELVDVNNTEDFEFLVSDNSATIAANYIQQQSVITGKQLAMLLTMQLFMYYF